MQQRKFEKTQIKRMQQKIVLDCQGIVMNSDDTLFDSKRFAEESILSYFHSLEIGFLKAISLNFAKVLNLM